MPHPAHPKQAAFHALTQRNRMFRGGIGAGKTLAGSRELMCSILEIYQESPALRAGNSPGLFLVGAPTYDMITVGPWHHITQWLSAFEQVNGFKLEKRRWESHPRRIELIGNLGVIKFLSVDNPSRWAAATAVGAYLDESELCKDAMGAYRMLQSRIRDNRAARHFMLCTSSPRGQRGVAQFFEDRIAASDPDFGLVVSATHENPGLPASYLQDLMSSMGEHERRQQIEAELIPDSNAIFGQEFHEEASMANHWKFRRSASWEWNIAIDWGGSYHGLLIAHDRDADIDIVFDEFIADGIQDIDFLKMVVSQCKAHWGIQQGDISEVICDYMPRESCRVAYNFWRGRVRHRRVRDNEDRWSRINTTRWRLLEAATGKRRLLFAPHLRQTKSKRGILQCMANYALGTRWAQGEQVVTDRPVQDSPWSHGSDAIALFCWLRYSHKRFHDRSAVGAQAA